MTLSDTIKAIQNATNNGDNCDDYNELGYEYKHYFYSSIQFAFDLIYVCKNCGQKNKSVKCIDRDCNNCYVEYISEKLDNIIDCCNDLKFEVDDYKSINYSDNTEVSKIKLNDDIYGIMLCTASGEPNSWSSTPHDCYFRTFMIYTNSKDRDNTYDNDDAIKNILSSTTYS